MLGLLGGTVPPPVAGGHEHYRSQLALALVEEGRPLMLAEGNAAARLPVEDLGRARAFYRDKLGLTPADERPGDLLYQSRGCEFELFQCAGQSPGTFTHMARLSLTWTPRSPSCAAAAWCSRSTTSRA